MNLDKLNQKAKELLLGKVVGTVGYQDHAIELIEEGSPEGSPEDRTKTFNLFCDYGTWIIYKGDKSLYDNESKLRDSDLVEGLHGQKVIDINIYLSSLEEYIYAPEGYRVPVIQIKFTNNWHMSILFDLENMFDVYESGLKKADEYLSQSDLDIEKEPLMVKRLINKARKSVEVSDESINKNKHEFACSLMTEPTLSLFSEHKAIKIIGHIKEDRSLKYFFSYTSGIELSSSS